MDLRIKYNGSNRNIFRVNEIKSTISRHSYLHDLRFPFVALGNGVVAFGLPHVRSRRIDEDHGAGRQLALHDAVGSKIQQTMSGDG